MIRNPTFPNQDESTYILPLRGRAALTAIKTNKNSFQGAAKFEGKIDK
jgi:hypothetical protein